MAAAGYLSQFDLEKGMCYNAIKLDKDGTLFNRAYAGKYIGQAIKDNIAYPPGKSGQNGQIGAADFVYLFQRDKTITYLNMTIEVYTLRFEKVDCPITGGRRRKAKTSKRRSRKGKTNKRSRKH